MLFWNESPVLWTTWKWDTHICLARFNLFHLLVVFSFRDEEPQHDSSNCTNHLIMTKIKPDHFRIISHKLRSYNVIFSDGFRDEVGVSSMASVFFILSCKFSQRMICTSQKKNQKYPVYEPKCVSILCHLFWHAYFWLLSLLVIGTWVWFHIIYLFTSRWHWNKEAESRSSIFCCQL